MCPRAHIVALCLALAACNTTRTASDPVDAGTTDDAPTADTGGDAASDPQADVGVADTDDVDADSEDATDAALDVVEDVPPDCGEIEPNACGGCAPLDGEPGDACACGQGALTCSTASPDALLCANGEGAPLYPDRDGDGWGAVDGFVAADCDAGVAAVDTVGDCDDADARIVPSDTALCVDNQLTTCPTDGSATLTQTDCDYRRCVADEATCVFRPWIAYTALVDDDGEPSFYGREQLFVVRTDGTGNQRLDTGDIALRDPVWSPDGTRIAYWGYRREDLVQLRVLDVATGEVHVVPTEGVTRLSEMAAVPPLWAQDGLTLFLWSRQERCALLADGSGATPACERLGRPVELIAGGYAVDGLAGVGLYWSEDDASADGYAFISSTPTGERTGERVIGDRSWVFHTWPTVAEDGQMGVLCSFGTTRSFVWAYSDGPGADTRLNAPTDLPVGDPVFLRDGSAAVVGLDRGGTATQLWLTSTTALEPLRQITASDLSELRWSVSSTDRQFPRLDREGGE